jgi:hypothetical protein
VSAPPDRRLRSHVAATAAIAAGFLAALVLVVVLGQQEAESPDQPVPTPTAAPALAQDTLLVQVTLGRVRASSLLTASGGEPDRAVLLSLPADILLVDGPEYTPLLDANLSLNRRLTARAAANTLGVRVDGGWRMERKALAGFVDAVGPVTVTVPQPTEFLDENGAPALTLPAGTSRLTGPDASWYAIGVIEGEDEIAGVQQRFEEVFVQAVSALPDDAEAIKALLTSLGALSDPLNGTGEVAEQLLGLRDALLAADPLSVALPFRVSTAADPVVTRQELEGGPKAAIGAFRVTDYVAATPTLREVFFAAPRVAEIDGKPRVLVWNASEQPLASEVALLEISDADFVAISAGQWPSVQEVSRINGAGFFQDGQSYAAAVAEALRLANPETFGDTGTALPTPPGSPTPAPGPTAPATMPPPDQTPWADVDVVFGLDYEPCPPDEPDCLVEELP